MRLKTFQSKNGQNVLTQVSVLMLMRTSGSQDLDALGRRGVGVAEDYCHASSFAGRRLNFDVRLRVLLKGADNQSGKLAGPGPGDADREPHAVIGHYNPAARGQVHALQGDHATVAADEGEDAAARHAEREAVHGALAAEEAGQPVGPDHRVALIGGRSGFENVGEGHAFSPADLGCKSRSDSLSSTASRISSGVKSRKTASWTKVSSAWRNRRRRSALL